MGKEATLLVQENSSGFIACERPTRSTRAALVACEDISAGGRLKPVHRDEDTGYEPESTYARQISPHGKLHMNSETETATNARPGSY